MSVASLRSATPARLLDAAVELFARNGFHGTSIRDIAERAGANVAAGHYHYGSKEGLYLEVLRAQFAEVRAELERRGATRSAPALRRASRAELVKLLEARILSMLEVMLGPPPSAHSQLMIWEMCDPTDAMPMIVAEFIEPQTREMEQLVSRLLPGVPRETITQIVFGILGLVLFYRFTMPMTLLLRGESRYPGGFARKPARHVTRFSMHAIDGIAADHRKRGGRRARAR
jgi:AcrR family transcriptional regulator